MSLKLTGPSLLTGEEAVSDATEGDKSLGRSCGPWHCYTDDIAVIRKRRGRFEGTLITVLAEALSVTNGMNIIAHHTTPLVLYRDMVMATG